MLLAIEGVAGSGKSTVRDRLLVAADGLGLPLTHVGQFSWLSLPATRAIVELRAGSAPSDDSTALAAAIEDLQLHVRHNISLAHEHAHVVADRLLLSTACLLALLYNTDPSKYLMPLSQVQDARPSLTILLTTDPSVIIARLESRRSTRRFGEATEALGRLSNLYRRAAQVWESETGGRVVLGPSLTSSDVDHFVRTAIDLLQETGAP